MANTMRFHSSYMSRAFANIDDIAATMRQQLLRHGVKYDTLVGTGLSGSLVVPTLARAFNVHWAIVRKNDGSHSGNSFEGEIGQRWLFVDDFIDSGATANRVKDIIAVTARQNGHTTEYVGTYEYQRIWWSMY